MNINSIISTEINGVAVLKVFFFSEVVKRLNFLRSEMNNNTGHVLLKFRKDNTEHFSSALLHIPNYRNLV